MQQIVAYNLLVGGTETAGLGHGANCRGALSAFSLPSKYFSLDSPGKAFFPCHPPSPLDDLSARGPEKMGRASQLGPKVARLCKRQGGKRKDEQRSFTREVVTGIGIPL